MKLVPVVVLAVLGKQAVQDEQAGLVFHQVLPDLLLHEQAAAEVLHFLAAVQQRLEVEVEVVQQDQRLL
jgi:hypothetical protein